MTPDEQMVVVFGLLHLIAAMLGAILLLMFMRSEERSEWRPSQEDDESGGGGNDRRRDGPKQTPPPGGGIPLPHAEQSRTRFRGPARLADAHPRRGRRSVPEPRRVPARTPAR